MNINDITFLKALNEERNKNYYARIIVLDKLDKIIKTIEGRVQQGSSINISGNSSIRRTCNINLVAEDAENDLTNIENFLSINKKIKIAVGIEKNIDYSNDVYYFYNKEIKYNEKNPEAGGFPSQGEPCKIYVDRMTMTYWKWDGRKYQQLNSIYEYQSELTWFPLGVFIICQPNITHTVSGCNISLSCKDKMCRLNGEMGGNLPTSVTFDKYDQIIGLREVTSNPTIDENLEPNNYTVYKYKNPDTKKYEYYTWDRQYGWSEPSEKDTLSGTVISVPQLIYDIIYTAVINYGGEDPARIIINDIPKEIKQLVRYVGSSPLYFNRLTGQYITDENYVTSEEGAWEIFNYNEDVGYVFTDFVYPGSLVTNIGENVGSVLEKIKNTLGNYEYFYDIDGNFVFQEIKNYLNTSYVPLEESNGTKVYYLENDGIYKEIKNDNNEISKVEVFNIDTNSLRIIGEENYKIDLCGNQKSIYTFDEGNGLITSYSNSPNYANIKNDYHIWGKNNDGLAIHYHLVVKDKPTVMQERQVVFLTEENDNTKYTGKLRLAREDDDPGIIYNYTPNDWRAELYLQGLEVAKGGARPDIYQQELLDLFDNIYEFVYYDDDGELGRKINDDIRSYEGRFKTDQVLCPNDLTYFMDYLEPTDKLYGISVDDIGPKLYSHQQDKIVRLYNREVPDYIIIDESMLDTYQAEIREKCNLQGQSFSDMSADLYKKLVIGTKGYSAQETARGFLYQYTGYGESISISSIPIYYLDVNRRITVKDKKSGINGDYIINSITLPLSPTSTMNISATRALTKI